MTLSIERQGFLSLICSIEIAGEILLSHPGFVLTRKKIGKCPLPTPPQ